MNDTPELGLAASFRSVPDMWHYRIRSTPDAPALRFLVEGLWTTISWSHAGQRVRALANGLLALDLQPSDRCAILAETCVEWILADLAILCAGAATTTAYPQTPDAELVHILTDSEARVLFVDRPEQARRIEALRGQLPHLRQVVVFAGDRLSHDDDWILSLTRFERMGRDHGARHPDAYEAAHRGIAPHDLATLMYTSGTTGVPRGVELSHDAWIYEAEAIDALGALTPADTQLLWLPLAHVFAKVLQLVFIRLGMPTAVDGRADALLPHAAAVRPTWMAAVPRTFEKLKHGIERRMRQRGPVAWASYQWALAVGHRMVQAREAGRVPVRLRLEHAAADQLVAAPLRARLGGRLRFVISGGAPLPASLGRYFAALGLTVLEGYGLTESAAASCVNRPGEIRFGTVGPPLPGCTVRIAEDGEILIRSRGLMKGYWRDPEGTAAAFTDDGFLRTGDLGLMRSTGHVQITGRKKEILVTAGGKNVAPRAIEQRLQVRSALIDHVVLHGDGRPWCVALITVDPRSAARWAREQEIAFADATDLVTHPTLEAHIEGLVRALNRELASFERIRRFVLLPEPFTEANGLLTPSAKVRRRAVEARYAPRLDALYAVDDPEAQAAS